VIAVVVLSPMGGVTSFSTSVLGASTMIVHFIPTVSGGTSVLFGDNQSVLWNTTIPDSTLKKKSNSIAYHFVREGCARDEWRTTYVNTHENPADLLTKPLSGEKRATFVRMVQHHIYGSSIGIEDAKGVD
jgi:hypothetical protein